MTCDAKIRPLPDPTEIRCDGNHEPSAEGHAGTLRDYAYPGSATLISWHERDRRNFRGDWLECPERGCILPAGHPGNHAQ